MRQSIKKKVKSTPENAVLVFLLDYSIEVRPENDSGDGDVDLHENQATTKKNEKLARPIRDFFLLGCISF